MKLIDVSHWQGKINWTKVTVPAAIIKCSQGTNFVDDQFIRNKKDARKNGILLGYYHFATGGDAVAEADFFVKSIGDIATGEFLVLDWEIPHPSPVGWCLTFLNRVYKKTGIKPLLYASESRIKQYNWSDVVKGDYGLWVAKYGINLPVMGFPPKTGNWPFYAIWQYTSRGSMDGVNGNVDMNYTKMDLNTLKKYGKR